ncbi:acylphosphatase [Enterococcus sp. JM4C]|uniref:acylphosphatase n=1 Tax=Candidatus Enterococcus huntleyi TaxID=1857217 RepID=UPI001379B0FB|nr:acylphosphatase [Enterococcus sp. JM4C]KAF1295829.1 acylphosphatase [Enterococcus sp. JM4C]
MKKVRINVDGRVQGVGFRYMTKIVADKIGIKGTVKNEDDGSVTIEAIGDEEQMDLFIKAVKASPSPSGRVTQFKMDEDASIEERKRFDVVYY